MTSRNETVSVMEVLIFVSIIERGICMMAILYSIDGRVRLRLGNSMF